jgi:hypothetical protein
MLVSRLAKRFVLVTVLAFLALVIVNTATPLPIWIYALSLPIAALLTFMYWQTFRGTAVCPTCNGTGKIQVQHEHEVETDVCYSCDGSGRVSTRLY